MGRSSRRIKITIAILLPFIGLVWYIYSKIVHIDEIHIIPNDFTGVVMILYDQKDSEDTKFENGSILYRIPRSGILKTKLPFVGGIKRIKYYHEIYGKREEIIYSWDYNQLSLNTVSVYGGSSGLSGQGDNSVRTTSYQVSTKKESDSLSHIRKRMRPLNIIKHQ